MNNDEENLFGQMMAWITNDRRLPYDLRMGLVRMANTPWFRFRHSFIKTDYRHKVSKRGGGPPSLSACNGYHCVNHSGLLKRPEISWNRTWAPGCTNRGSYPCATTYPQVKKWNKI